MLRSECSATLLLTGHCMRYVWNWRQAIIYMLVPAPIICVGMQLVSCYYEMTLLRLMLALSLHKCGDFLIRVLRTFHNQSTNTNSLGTPRRDQWVDVVYAAVSGVCSFAVAFHHLVSSGCQQLAWQPGSLYNRCILWDVKSINEPQEAVAYVINFLVFS